MSRTLTVGLAILGIGLALLLFNNHAGSTLGIGNDRFARLVQLAALAVVLGAVVWSRRNAQPRLAHAAAWLAIVLVLAGAYQYRFELQDFASHATGGLIPPPSVERFIGDPGAGIEI